MKKNLLSDSFSGFTIAITISIMPRIEKTVRGATDQKKGVLTAKVVLISNSSKTVHRPRAMSKPPMV